MGLTSQCPNCFLRPRLTPWATVYRHSVSERAGAERREEVAHGVSRGICGQNRTSPGGASENKSHPVSRLRGLRIRLILSPLTGLDLLLHAVPRLAPWATIWRRYAAGTTRNNVT